MTNNNNFKALLIDFDGTLIDYRENETQALEHLLDKYNFPVEKQKEAILVYKRLNETLWGQLEKKTHSIDFIQVQRFREFLDHFSTDIKEIDPLEMNKEYLNYFISLTNIDGKTINLLKRLKETYKLIIITNGIHHVQEKRITKLGLLDIIETFFTSESVGEAKPGSAMFEAAVNLLQDKFHISKDKILVIGDSYNADIIGGINFGLKTCWISNGNKLEIENSDQKPDFVLNHFNDINKILS